MTNFFGNPLGPLDAPPTGTRYPVTFSYALHDGKKPSNWAYEILGHSCCDYKPAKPAKPRNFGCRIAMDSLKISPKFLGGRPELPTDGKVYVTWTTHLLRMSYRTVVTHSEGRTDLTYMDFPSHQGDKSHKSHQLRGPWDGHHGVPRLSSSMFDWDVPWNEPTSER